MWCAPCVKQMPEFAKLVDETKDKGLVAISVDQDEEPNTAAHLLAKNGYKWLNFHDVDGSVSKALISSGIPRTILIDAQGKVVLDRMGVGDDELPRRHCETGTGVRLDCAETESRTVCRPEVALTEEGAPSRPFLARWEQLT